MPKSKGRMVSRPWVWTCIGEGTCGMCNTQQVKVFEMHSQVVLPLGVVVCQTCVSRAG